MSAADLDAFYADGELVVRAGAPSFRGFLTVADEMAFDTSQVADYTLRYPAAGELARGESLSIEGASYSVATHPRRIGDGRECEAALMRESA